MTGLIRRIDRYSMMLLATVLLASVLPAVGTMAQVLGWITRAAIALLFFLHGAKLSREAIVAGATNWKLHAAVLALTFAVFPLLGIGLGGVLGSILEPGLVTGIVFLALLPSTVQSSIAFTSIARGNVPAAVCAATLSNILGIFLTPLLVALVIGAASRGSDDGWLGSVGAIVVQLLLPFILGHLCRPLLKDLLARHKSLVTGLDRGSILLVVYGAFSAAVVEGLWHAVPGWQIGALVVADAVLLAIVLALSHQAGQALGLDSADRATLLFCGSKKSLASGVPMAGVLFPAAQVGAVILPLMIFHQLQLLVCAAIAQRMAASGSELSAAQAAG
ncbi:bile acid:sodium symporter [Novosphingobium sp. YJ-S2-02]|uniref:Bile acid:sodium symporter n=1 Tax=Novosphingobium aureum TaxID=2792964 RepID=A0A931MM60_9SPHN|nr:bile acid:sodium symporter family protein [Novosphingobium aureum]MBH0114070.1 bile acid:sodium symporter [Novosphingobium aureum]